MCGEKYIHPGDAEKIFAINKLVKKEWLAAEIAKVGNSFVFRVHVVLELYSRRDAR